MFLYGFPYLCQGFGNLGYVEFTVCLYKRILHLRIRRDDGWEVNYRHLMEQDITLEQLSPHQHTCSLPHFHSCRRELSEEWRMKGEEFMGSSSQFFHVICIVDICFYRKSTNTIGSFKLILALCEQVEQAWIFLLLQIGIEFFPFVLTLRSIIIIEASPWADCLHLAFSGLQEGKMGIILIVLVEDRSILVGLILLASEKLPKVTSEDKLQDAIMT